MSDLMDKGPKRLGLIEAINRKGYNSYVEVGIDLEKQLRRDGYKDQTVNDKAVAQYANFNCNFSLKKVSALATLLGVLDQNEINDVWDPPIKRGYGRDWVNRRNNETVKIWIYIQRKGLEDERQSK